MAQSELERTRQALLVARQQVTQLEGTLADLQYQLAQEQLLSQQLTRKQNKFDQVGACSRSSQSDRSAGALLILSRTALLSNSSRLRVWPNASRRRGSYWLMSLPVLRCAFAWPVYRCLVSALMLA